MATHKSAIKRIRQTEKRRLLNKYFHKTTRNTIKKLQDMKTKKEAITLLSKVTSMIDKLTKRNIIHKNKSSNLKSKLTKQVNAMS